MLGLEFDFPVAEIRKTLIHKHHIFTGSSKNPNLIRILPPLTIQKEHFRRNKHTRWLYSIQIHKLVDHFTE